MSRARNPKSAASVLRAGCAAFCLFGLFAQTGLAQSVVLDFSQRLAREDGLNLSQTLLGATVQRETRRESLTFSAGGNLEQTFGDGEGLELVDPRVDLGYLRNNRDGSLGINLGYNERDILDAGDRIDAAGDILTGGGTRDTTRADISYSFGETAPFGGTASFDYAALRFDGTTDDNLVPSDSYRGDVSLRFDLDSRTSLVTDFGVSDIDRDGGTDIFRQNATIGLTYDVDSALTTGFDLGVSRVVEDNEETEGLIGRLNFDLDQRDGTLSGSLESDFNENGRRTTVSLSRAREFDDGNLVAGIGLSEGETGSIRPLVNVSYNRVLPSSRIGISASQDFDSNSAGDEVLNSSLDLTYSTDLTDRTSFESLFGFSDSNVTGDSGDDRRRFDVSLGVTYALTERLNLEAGYSYTETLRGDTEDIRKQIFIGVNTSFAWR